MTFLQIHAVHPHSGAHNPTHSIDTCRTRPYTKTKPSVSARRSTFLSSKMTPTEPAQPMLEAEAVPRDGPLPELCTQGSACSVLLLTRGPAAPPALNFITQRAPGGPTGSSAAQHLPFDLLCQRATYVPQNTTRAHSQTRLFSAFHQQLCLKRGLRSCQHGTTRTK